MIPRLLYVYYLLVAGLLGYMPCSAQALPPVTITYLGIEQGLSNNAVRCIYKDQKGFMWFGTYDGLTRYDGHNCKVFRNKFGDSSSLVNNWIYAIGEDAGNNLWIGTRQGLSIYNSFSGSFSFGWYLPFQQATRRKMTGIVKDIRRDAAGQVWVATQRNGLLRYAKNKVTGSQVPLEGSSEIEYEVQALEITADQQVWAFIQGKGLCRYDAQQQQLRLVHRMAYSASCIEADGNTLWIGTTAGVFRYDQVTGVSTPALDKAGGQLSSDVVTGLTIDRNKDLWIATNGGGVNIRRHASGRVDRLSAGTGSNALTSEAVYTILEDETGRKWIGTLRGGVNIIDPQKERFATVARDPFHPGNTLTNNFVYSFYEDRNGSIWIGTDGGGLSSWNRAANTFTNYRHETGKTTSLSDNAIPAITADAADNIWVGTFFNGINRFNRATASFKKYACMQPGGFENKVAYTLYTDRRNNIWAGTLREGGTTGAVYLFNAVQDKFEMFDTKLSDMLCFKEDKAGVLWAGNFTQLVQVDQGSKQHRFYEIGKPVRAILEDAHHNLWLGTEGGGLVLFDRKTSTITKRYTTENGLCNNSILAMLEDKEGALWMSTFDGISRFNTTNGSFKNYYQEDGLQSNQFMYGAALALQSGEFMFGGIKGFNLFNPAAITPVNNAASVLLTDIKVDNVFLQDYNNLAVANNGKEWTEIKVPYNKAVFTFSFTTPEYSAPGKITYAYYMEGWDRGWNNNGNSSTAVYTHLGEGTYTFHVKSTTTEGVWNGREIALKVIVLPPWYRSWWAFILYVLLLAAAIYCYHLYKTRQTTLQYEVTIANLNAAREKAERETESVRNEKKLSFFTHVSHEFRTPLTLIINPIREMLSGGQQATDREELNTVYRNARRLLSLVDQLLLFRKADSEGDSLKLVQLNFSQVCHEVYLCFVHQAKIKNIDYRFESAAETITLYADREKIEIVLFNLLSNALKFTPPGGRVIFSVEELTDAIQVSVTDTGEGIPVQAGDQLFNRFYQVKEAQGTVQAGFGIGLYLVKHFVESHQGTVTYTSKKGEGTQFSVVLLKGKAHFGDAPVFSDVPEESIFLQELAEEQAPEKAGVDLAVLVTEQKTILLIDDDAELRKYIAQLFADGFTILEAASGEEGIHMAQHYLPDIIISDVTMQGMNGIELCSQVKNDPRLCHIPVILLTASAASDNQLKGIESGADDYITKPFEKELLKARVIGLLKKRNTLQQYFYNEITLKKNELKVSVEYKEFLEKCIRIVESHLDDDNFSIKTLAQEIGMSHSGLYKKVKSVSGQSISAFIRFIRLRKAAELMINTEQNITEIASQVGFNNIKYFRQHFNELFGMNPSEYIRKYRNSFHNTHQINPNIIKD
jgi:signal transduction histidine kinase/ligand-binding sensor domain-containing protein/CheY-like chemotaxis protein/AraC-like DNA-binding protein